MVLRLIIAALTVFLVTAPVTVRAETPVFSARNGIAIGGYDVVAFFDQQHAISGRQEFSLMWKGVIWHFVSAQNQARFEANPRAYAPAFGGYCAYAISQGYLAPGDPHLWVIENGELLLLNNTSVHGIWKDEAVNLMAVARDNWPSVIRE